MRCGRLRILVLAMAALMVAAAFGRASVHRASIGRASIGRTSTWQASIDRTSARTERSYAASKVEVDAALKSLEATAGGRLPTLDGFIGEQSLPLDRLQHPHYAYLVEVVPKASGVVVSVRARITAWFSGPSVAQSGYRVLPSNGRLESDLLERLEDALAQKSRAPAATAAAPAAAAPPQAADAKAAAPNALFTSARPRAALPPRSSVDSSASGPPSGKRNSASYAQALREQAKNLEEVLRNQTRPTDLAAVRKGRTPVYSRPSEQGEVLFLADAQDEFQVLNTSSEWVHVQISGLSRGWIRGPDLELPSREARAPVPVAPAALAGRTADPLFRLARQEVNTYPGDWAPLRGKPVRILSLAPTGTATTSASQKWEVARGMFRRAAARLATQESGSAPVEGVVLIFDSADGGMASAAVASLKEWDEGRLSDEGFREQCSFDPPEAFRK